MTTRPLFRTWEVVAGTALLFVLGAFADFGVFFGAALAPADAAEPDLSAPVVPLMVLAVSLLVVAAVALLASSVALARVRRRKATTHVGLRRPWCACAAVSAGTSVVALLVGCVAFLA